MRPEDLRRWIAGQRAAEEAAHAAEQQHPATPAVCWQQALSLLALLDETVGWPVLPDELRRREEAAAAAAWRRVRAAWGPGR